MYKLYKEALQRSADYNRLEKCVREGLSPISVFGMSESQKSHITAALAEGRGLLYVTATSGQAERAAQDLATFTGERTVLFPAREWLLAAKFQSHEMQQARISAIYSLLEGVRIAVAPIDALQYNLMPPYRYQKLKRTINNNSKIDIKDLTAFLTEASYQAVEQVETNGQYCIRGGIIDIFPSGMENAVRIELFDDEIDSIRLIDIDSQRSIGKIERFTLMPASEVCLSEHQKTLGAERLRGQLTAFLQRSKDQKACVNAKENFSGTIEMLEQLGVPDQLDGLMPYFYPEYTTLLDFLPKDGLVLLDEPKRLHERCENVLLEFSEFFKDFLAEGKVLPLHAEALHTMEQLLEKLKNNIIVTMQSITSANRDISPKAIFTLSGRTMQSFQGKVEFLAQELTTLSRRGFVNILFAGSKSRAQRLLVELENQNIYAHSVEDLNNYSPIEGETLVLTESISRGFEYPELKLAVISENDIFSAARQKLVKKGATKKTQMDLFTQLQVGDFAVHETNGIGIYEGLVKIETDGIFRDYLSIKYRDGDRLYVPIEQMHRVQKFIAAEDSQPKLSKLGTKEWTTVKSRVKKAIKDMADQLIALYRAREQSTGYAFSPDTPWQRQFEEDFPYEETPDQLQCIEEIKRDMESHRVMDRLLCGDVGYGKTEVALRAVFKAVMDGKQAAILAPTTILAQQHYNTIKSRLLNYEAVNCDVISRFRSPKEQRRIVKDLKAGVIDIIIGTHRLLGSDIQFKDLGLLVIDEEQRFGVSHKEKIKSIKQNVDVLTLTATPIPRTLNMSLTGIRDMSIIENPPEERYPVQTYVVEYSDTLVRDAIHRELSRGGQVYYLYNKVQSIDSFAEKLSKIVPEARIAIGHGQMPENQLEKVMLDFYNGEFDVLLCTTIIESGLDIPLVNTIIIYDSDKFGLAQLYQLRGRVGRSNRLAYAYFTVQRDKAIGEIAEKRLNAIREFTEFGAGFKISMRDLEIRGAGNVLGGEQSGHMSQVGYDLYCKLVKETVQEAAGNTNLKLTDTVVEIKADAYIDSAYIPSEMQKLSAYKRIAAIEKLEDKEDIIEELTDRYGDLPGKLLTLIDIAYIRALATKAGLSSVQEKNGELLMLFAAGENQNIAAIIKTCDKFKDKCILSAGKSFAVVSKIKGKGTAAALAWAKEFLEELNIQLNLEEII